MRRNPGYFWVRVELQNHARDQTQARPRHCLGFQCRAEMRAELSRHPEKHLPEDFLLACELVVERPPGHAGRPGQFVHAHRSESMFQEQARSGLDDGFPGSSARNPRDHPVGFFSKLHPRSLYCTKKCNLIYGSMSNASPGGEARSAQPDGLAGFDPKQRDLNSSSAQLEALRSAVRPNLDCFADLNWRSEAMGGIAERAQSFGFLRSAICGRTAPSARSRDVWHAVAMLTIGGALRSK